MNSIEFSTGFLFRLQVAISTEFGAGFLFGVVRPKNGDDGDARGV